MVSRAIDLGGKFFFPNRNIVLAPGRKPSKLQSQMASSLEDLSAKFDGMAKQFDYISDMAKRFTGLHEMMRQTLDSVNGMGLRQTSAETLLGDLRERAEATTTTVRDAITRIDNLVRRVDFLEVSQPHAATGRTDAVEAPQPAGMTGPSPGPGVLGAIPPTATLAPHPTRVLDMNVAPGTSSRSPVADVERPVLGHGEHCGEFQGTRAQYIIGGTSSDSQFVADASLRPPPFPKLEFPKFDGSNPRLWQDHCSMYFEVYAVHTPWF